MKTAKTVMTIGIAHKMAKDEEFAKGVTRAMTRYLMHDWGNISEDSKKMNEEALQTKDEIMGIYEIGSDNIYVITDPYHKVTTILLSDEY